MIPKPNFDISNPNIKYFRPITLLPILGKVLERLIITPLTREIFINDSYSKVQFGFTRQTSTIDALLRFNNYIKTSLVTKGTYVIAVSLGITGAFDNACWSSIINNLIAKGCSKNLIEMIISFFTNRKAGIKFGNTSNSRSISQGCPQGSVGAPILWNVFLDSLFGLLDSNQDFDHIIRQAFADDTIIFTSFTLANMEQQFESINNALRVIHQWGIDNRIEFNPTKTQAIIFRSSINKWISNPPSLHMNNFDISISDNIKYLGIIFNSCFTFTPHIDYVIGKAKKALNYLSIHTKNTYGSTPEVIRSLVNSLIYPVITYGSVIWFERLRFKKFWYKLRSFSYLCEKKICCSYRTSSMTSNILISGNLPLELRAVKLAAIDIFKRISYAPSLSELKPYLSTESLSDSNKRSDLYIKLLIKFLDSKFSLIDTDVGNANLLMEIPSFPELISFSCSEESIMLEPKVHWTVADQFGHFTINFIQSEDIGEFYDLYVFTDGSKKKEVDSLNPLDSPPGSTGFGYCFQYYHSSYFNRKSFPIHNRCSNYQAEALAICGALADIIDNHFDSVKKILICTDSTSLIADINKLQTDKPIILSIKQYLYKIYDHGISIDITWIKSHTSTTNHILYDGNREADLLANRGADTPLSNNYFNLISIETFKNNFEVFLWYSVCNYVFSASKPFGKQPLNDHLKSIIPVPSSSVVCNKIKRLVKGIDFHSVQFLNRHGTNGAYLKRIKVTPSDICVLFGSNEIDDVNQALFECSATFDQTFVLNTLGIYSNKLNSIFEFLANPNSDHFYFSDVLCMLVIKRNITYVKLKNRNNDDLPG